MEDGGKGGAKSGYLESDADDYGSKPRGGRQVLGTGVTGGSILVASGTLSPMRMMAAFVFPP